MYAVPISLIQVLGAIFGFVRVYPYCSRTDLLGQPWFSQ